MLALVRTPLLAPHAAESEHMLRLPCMVLSLAYLPHIWLQLLCLPARSLHVCMWLCAHAYYDVLRFASVLGARAHACKWGPSTDVPPHAAARFALLPCCAPMPVHAGGTTHASFASHAHVETAYAHEDRLHIPLLMKTLAT
jgi:hypothetical protein